jgi:hypothetical protein
MSSLAKLLAIQERDRVARAARVPPVLGGVPAGGLLGDPGGVSTTPAGGGGCVGGGG